MAPKAKAGDVKKVGKPKKEAAPAEVMPVEEDTSAIAAEGLKQMVQALPTEEVDEIFMAMTARELKEHCQHFGIKAAGAKKSSC